MVPTVGSSALSMSSPVARTDLASTEWSGLQRQKMNLQNGLFAVLWQPMYLHMYIGV